MNLLLVGCHRLCAIQFFLPLSRSCHLHSFGVVNMQIIWRDAGASMENVCSHYCNYNEEVGLRTILSRKQTHTMDTIVKKFNKKHSN